MTIKAWKQTVRHYYKYVDEAWTQPVLTSNGTIGGNSFAVSANSGATYLIYKAFDNNISQQSIYAGTTIPEPILIYNPLPLKVTNIAFTNATGSSLIGTPTAGDIYGSNNNTDWTHLTSFTNNNISSFSTWNVSISGTYYKYYKINITSVSSTTYPIICEISLTATQGIAQESTSSDYDFYEDVDTYYGYKDSNDIYYGFNL